MTFHGPDHGVTVWERGGHAALVAMSAVSKSFGGRAVLDRVDFDLRSGEVHALLGENGAGKSTLMNVLAGLYAADAGTIAVDGRSVEIANPGAAAALGIGMVHQHFRLVPTFTAAENLMLSADRRLGLSSVGAAAERLIELGRRTGLDVDPNAVVERLSVAGRQRVEILKVLALGSRILILDEPTAVLTDEEAASMLKVVRDLAADGLAVVLITHKLREVLGAADRVSVMRLGRMAASGLAARDVDAASLARAMMGPDVATAATVKRPPFRTGHVEERLIVSGLSSAGGGTGITDVAFTLHAGEILGVAGVGGNGQGELVEILSGLRPVDAGFVALDGLDVTHATPAFRRERGFRIIPADRSESALAGDLTVAENLALTEARSGRFGRWLMSRATMAAAAAAAISNYAIAGAVPRRPVRLLSGGNAQKVVLARELDGEARVIVAHSPTRGLDVGACRFVHEALAEAARRGAGILLVSEDIEEILALSHRVLVMTRGRIAGDCGADPAREVVGRLMLGHA